MLSFLVLLRKSLAEAYLDADEGANNDDDIQQHRDDRLLEVLEEPLSRHHVNLGPDGQAERGNDYHKGESPRRSCKNEPHSILLF